MWLIEDLVVVSAVVLSEVVGTTVEVELWIQKLQLLMLLDRLLLKMWVDEAVVVVSAVVLSEVVGTTVEVRVWIQKLQLLMLLDRLLL